MKTFDRKDVFSWSNCEEAKQYTNKAGYFADVYSDNLDDWYKDILISIDKNRAIDAVFESVNNLRGLFLPADKVKEEKKYRPFKHYLEFTEVTHKKVGDVIEIASKDKSYEAMLVITGKNTNNNKETVMMFGRQLITLSKLCEDFLWLDANHEWQPFGVLDES